MKPISRALKTFQLELSGTQITDKSIEALARENLTLMNNLNEFRLFLMNLQITDQGIGTLCADLQGNLKKLKCFELNLFKTQITDKSLFVIGSSVLSNMFNLEECGMSLPNTATNIGISDLCVNFAQTAKTVKSCRLHLSGTKITDDNVIYLGKKIIPEMIALVDFTLNISYTKITGEGIQELYEALQAIIQNLATFQLYLIGTKVTKKLIQKIMNLFDSASLSNLKKFDITFDKKKGNNDLQNKIAIIKNSLHRE